MPEWAWDLLGVLGLLVSVVAAVRLLGGTPLDAMLAVGVAALGLALSGGNDPGRAGPS